MIYQFRVSWPTFSFDRFPNIELVSGTPVACNQSETRSAEGRSPVPPKDPAAEAAFQEEARKYREIPVKPPVPEEAHKYAVQGDFAAEKKNLAAAADRYADALKVAPWWPEGHFKRGRILADMERYGEAVDEMKKFLLLAPDAKEAREAQDNIYKWESAGTLTASQGSSRADSASGQSEAAAADGVMTFTGKIETFRFGPFQFRSGPPLWPSGMIVVATENGEKRNFLIVGSGTSATLFYDGDGTARGNLASGNARVHVGKKVEVKYVSAPANYATKDLAVSVRYLE
jgi:tetratricopeptide (TPR) repeat protein